MRDEGGGSREEGLEQTQWRGGVGGRTCSLISLARTMSLRLDFALHCAFPINV